MEKISRLVIDDCGKEYEFEGGGSITPGEPIPENTVDSKSIQDEAVKLEDLNQEVKDELVDRVSKEDLDGFQV